jgi:hypothetical protein
MLRISLEADYTKVGTLEFLGSPKHWGVGAQHPSKISKKNSDVLFCVKVFLLRQKPDPLDE